MDALFYSYPAEVLHYLSSTVSSSLTSEIDEDPDNAKYETALLADTMRFLRQQSRYSDEVILANPRATLTTKEDQEDLAGSAAAQEVLAAGRDRLGERNPELWTQDEVAAAVVETNAALLEAVNDALWRGHRRVRNLVYELFEARVESELDVLR